MQLVYHNSNKVPVHLKSQIPKRCKRNAVNGDLHRSWRISSNFYYEKNKVKNKFSNAGYLVRFINSVINNYESKKHDAMILSYLFKDFD